MTNKPPPKINVSYRLTGETTTHLSNLSSLWGVSKTTVLEIAVRRLAIVNNQWIKTQRRKQ